MELVKVKQVELKVVFSIWDNEVIPANVPQIVVDAIDKAGYALESCEIVDITESTKEV